MTHTREGVEVSNWVAALWDAPTPEEGRIVLHQLRTLFEQKTNMTGFNREADYKAPVAAAQGVAISINQTVRCFHDERRTLLFFRAMVRAIRDKQKQHPGETIRVCYAGCGPYAPFCTLVAPLFSPEEVQFTLLEINPISLAQARKLVSSLGLSDYVSQYLEADAVIHQLEEAAQYHILFSETLDAALHRECFVPILLNLLPQLSPDITLIPENVILRAALLNQQDFPTGNSDVRNPQAVYPEKKLGEVFNVQQTLTPSVCAGPSPRVFPSVSISVPEVFDYDYLVIYTDVQVYQDLWLYRGESLLTEPLLRSVRRVVSSTELQFTYQLAPEVELLLE